MPLRLLDYSDRELLIMVHEVAQEHGGSAPSAEIATALGLTEKERTSSVGSRMAAMRRFGVVEKIPKRNPSEWSLTTLGEALAFGTARKAQLQAIDGSKPEELLLMVREMGKRQYNEAEGARHLIRREWLRSTHRNGVR